MTLDAVALVKRYHAALNAYDAAEVAEMFAEDAVYVSPGVNGRLAGKTAIIAAFSAYFAEHPDQHAVDDDIAPAGPHAARALWRLEATAKSSGRRIVRRGLETVRFDETGRILSVEVQDL